MKPNGVSIVICCHNGATRLPETIRHIARQQVPPYIAWELLIIDNGSTDGSALVARKEWRKHRVDLLRIISEPALGLSYARSRGFSEARYEYIIFCDDDNWLEEHYVRTSYEILCENPAIGALGGFGKLVYEIEPPVAEPGCLFAGGKQAPASGKVEAKKVYGAGCVIRHSAYDRLLASGFKTRLTDRKGAELSSGGDYELCLALAVVGYEIWYDERLRFTHFITRERLTWEYFVRYASESSRCFNVLTSYRMVADNAPISRLAWLVILRNFMVCLKFFFSINLQRAVTREASGQRFLYFRHLVYKHKLKAYLLKSYAMVETHQEIANFQASCRPAQHRPKPIIWKEYARSFMLSFFSKPYRQLP